METLSDDQIIEKIKTFKDACIELRIPVKRIAINDSVNDIANSVDAFYQLCIITRALNQNWVPDLKNNKENKWYNLFFENFLNGGADACLACSYSFTSPADAFAYVDTRLCFKSRKLAMYASQQFLSLYEQYLLIK